MLQSTYPAGSRLISGLCSKVNMSRHAWNSVTCNYSDMFTFEAFTVLRVINILLYPVTLIGFFSTDP